MTLGWLVPCELFNATTSRQACTSISSVVHFGIKTQPPMAGWLAASTHLQQLARA
jgi:hypothetical protein